jgi:hypothetical protein
MTLEEQLKPIADQFGQHEVVKGRLHAFDGSSWIDPLTLWSLRRIGDRQIEWLIILLDWMPASQAEKLEGEIGDSTVGARALEYERSILHTLIFESGHLPLMSWCIRGAARLSSGLDA